MKFGFRNLMAAMMGVALMGQAGQSAAKSTQELEKSLRLATPSSDYTWKHPRSKRPTTKRVKKQNKLRLSHNAKLKRRRTK
ncbi:MULTISPECIES: hypothetical protein [unclassified Pedobacter]|uniref:hypothetical protein n=1 Tax=unclassified Pedobacter TaxID=2628915 RepID=UPI0014212F45|nr:MULTISPECIES: hypothetical protein [unclassified Pedobacter]NII81720.1 hypothetical protein [Pedobacter sp. SG908]NMN35724.1 hypothetical protein [Pedobacter sp. SG918]